MPRILEKSHKKWRHIMNKLIRQSVYFLGGTYFTIYMSKFLGTMAAWLAFWPVLLANHMERFILTRDILTFGLLNIAWIIIFPAFIVELLEYKNRKSQEIDWKDTSATPKKEFVSVMEQVARESAQVATKNAEEVYGSVTITPNLKLKKKDLKKQLKKLKKKEKKSKKEKRKNRRIY